MGILTLMNLITSKFSAAMNPERGAQYGLNKVIITQYLISDTHLGALGETWHPNWLINWQLEVPLINWQVCWTESLCEVITSAFKHLVYTPADECSSLALGEGWLPRSELYLRRHHSASQFCYGTLPELIERLGEPSFEDVWKWRNDKLMAFGVATYWSTPSRLPNKTDMSRNHELAQLLWPTS